jgi:hypothetical protein
MGLEPDDLGRSQFSVEVRDQKTADGLAIHVVELHGGKDGVGGRWIGRAEYACRTGGCYARVSVAGSFVATGAPPWGPGTLRTPVGGRTIPQQKESGSIAGRVVPENIAPDP